MENTSQALMDWAVDKIKREYPDDVALLVAEEGHQVDGDGHGIPFDYFIPATSRGEELAQTFIIGGVGHDLYPRTWERMERTADLVDSATDTLLRAKILYSRTPEDEARFWALRQRLLNNLADPEFRYRRALERIDGAMGLHQTMLFEEGAYKVRMGLGYLAWQLASAVVLLNGHCPGTWPWAPEDAPRLEDMKELPVSFLEDQKALQKPLSLEEMRRLAWRMLKETRAFARRKAPEKKDTPASNLSGLADWYQELSLTWRRLRYFCGVGNEAMALSHACYLQAELLVTGEEFRLGEMDLLGSYDQGGLALLKERGDELEGRILSALEAAGVSVKRYAAVEEFLAQN